MLEVLGHIFVWSLILLSQLIRASAGTKERPQIKFAVAAPPATFRLRSEATVGETEDRSQSAAGISGTLPRAALNLARIILPPHEPNDVPAQTILPHHEPHEILVRTILHPCPLPLGEGKLSPDGVVRRMITKVQGFNARMFRGNLTPALSRPPSAVSLLRGSLQDEAACGPQNSRNAPCYGGRAGRGRIVRRWFARTGDNCGSGVQCANSLEGIFQGFQFAASQTNSNCAHMPSTFRGEILVSIILKPSLSSFRNCLHPKRSQSVQIYHTYHNYNILYKCTGHRTVPNIPD
jgi:hypothetical protein